MAGHVLVRKASMIGFIRGNISDDYEVVKRLGQGNFGFVVEARHKLTGLHHAVKVIPRASITSPERLNTEITLMKEADLPQIVKMFEVFEDANNINVVMELCIGGDLGEYLVKKNGLSEKEVIVIARQLLVAVNYLHLHGVCHRDLKPENLMFADLDNIDSLKLIDFGLSKVTEVGGKMKSIVGTPSYIAPEVLTGTYGVECDMWSIGVILFLLLGGQLPFTGRTQPEVLAKVTRGEFSFSSPRWTSVSDTAKQYISTLLSLNPRDRMTARQALDHHWLSSAPEPIPDFNPANTIEFKSDEKLAQSALLCIATMCSERDIMEMKRIFQSMDVNSDGIVSLAELQRVVARLKPDECVEFIRKLDLDQNGAINYSEFLAVSLNEKLYLQEDKLWAAFRAFDKDNSGRISISDLRRIIETSREISDQEFWETIIKSADKNGDHEIDFDEFMEMVSSKFRETYR